MRPQRGMEQDEECEGVMRDQNDRDTDLDHGVVTETEKKLKKPPLYKVLLHK